MKYLRMISNINHWDIKRGELYPNCFSTGDILQSDLRTANNTLSIWCYENDQDKEKIIAAMALGRQHIQKLIYVIMDEDEIKRLEIPIEEEQGIAEGITDIKILNKHRNMAKIDFWRLGYVAEYMFKLVENNNHETKTENKIFELLDKFMSAGIIDIEKMNDDLKNSFINHKNKKRINMD